MICPNLLKVMTKFWGYSNLFFTYNIYIFRLHSSGGQNRSCRNLWYGDFFRYKWWFWNIFRFACNITKIHQKYYPSRIPSAWSFANQTKRRWTQYYLNKNIFDVSSKQIIFIYFRFCRVKSTIFEITITQYYVCM